MCSHEELEINYTEGTQCLFTNNVETVFHLLGLWGYSSLRAFPTSEPGAMGKL